MSAVDIRVLRFANSRKISHARSQKSTDSTVVMMQKLFQCRFLKPQRLIHLSAEEEKVRLLETWQYWDHVIWLAAFGSDKELGEHLVDPPKFRKNLPNCVIAMTDQMPFWIKLTPGKQCYAKGEFKEGTVKKRKTITEVP